MAPTGTGVLLAGGGDGGGGGVDGAGGSDGGGGGWEGDGGTEGGWGALGGSGGLCGGGVPHAHDEQWLLAMASAASSPSDEAATATFARCMSSSKWQNLTTWTHEGPHDEAQYTRRPTALDGSLKL